MDKRYPPALTYDQAAKEAEARAGSPVAGIIQNDPAFGPPGDPLTLPNAKASAQVVRRSIPLVTIQNTWEVNQARSALAQHSMGVFEMSGQLCDSQLGDDRIMATLGSLRAGLFGREIRHRPANDSRAAKEAFDAWVEHWPQFEANSDLGLCFDYEKMMGFADAQLVWDTRKLWKPYLRFWHPRYSYFNWDVRKLIAITQDGNQVIVPGNGKWVHHSRYGVERCWIRGAIRATTEPFLGRHWALRDWLRYSELHGLPVEIAETPMSADPVERSQFGDQIANRGSNTAILMGKGVDKDSSYDYRLVEATDRNWESFPGLRGTCDMAIVLAIMFQNLTTEVSEGALASTSSHMEIRDASNSDSNTAWRNTIHDQIARPFAYFNFGDADLAPYTDRDVSSKAQREANAKQFQAFGTSVQALGTGGITFKDEGELRAFLSHQLGLYNVPAMKISEPSKPSAGAAAPAVPAVKAKGAVGGKT